MKKTISTFLALIIITTLSGCNSSNDKGGKLDNLDYENAEIIENTPESGKWQKLSFEFQHLNKNSPDKMVKFAASYGENLKTDDIKFVVFNEENGENQFIPQSEYDDYVKDMTKYADYPFSSAIYNSGDFYMEVQAYTGGMVELDNRKNVNAILEPGFNSEVGTWRPSFFSKKTTSVDLSDENAVCVLGGKTVKIADAIKNAENFVLENNILFPENFGAKVTNVELFTYENGNQSLSMLFEYTIDGVVLDGSPSYAIEDEDGNRYKTFPSTVQIAMLTENTLDWIWFPAIDGGTEFTSEDCEIEISRERACELASQKLSREYRFNVKEIQLMYMARQTGGGKLYTDASYARIEPMWRFHITDIKTQEYSELYVYVSAIDGEVQISEVMK